MIERLIRGLQGLTAVLLVASLTGSAAATPFGEGVFGADVPFGSSTSLSINLGSSPSMTLTPSGATFTGNGSQTITITSTDAVGYKLYARSLGSSDMTNGSYTIPASANVSASTLATNTWGYNTTGSTSNFIGMTTTSALLKDAIGPYKNGDNTTVTYGVLASIVAGAGSYTNSVIFTAVCSTD